MDLLERTYDNAPPEVTAVGGVALSLWMTGAGETDVRIVAERIAQLQQLRGAVKALRPFVEKFDAVGREFCPSFDGPLDLEAFNRAARIVGGQ